MPPARILVAVKPEPLPIVESALSGSELLIAKDFEHGQELVLNEDFDLIVIGILFDESRGMELIKVVRTASRNIETPIVVVRLMPSIHEAMLNTVMDTMIALGTVSAYLEGDLKEPRLKQRLRTLFETYLPAENA